MLCLVFSVNYYLLAALFLKEVIIVKYFVDFNFQIYFRILNHFVIFKFISLFNLIIFVILRSKFSNQCFLVNFYHNLNLQTLLQVYLFSIDPIFVFSILLLDYLIQNFHFINLNPITFKSIQMQLFKMLDYSIY